MSDYGQYTQNAIRNFLADNLPNSSDGEMTSATSATVDHSASTSSRRGEGMVEGGARHTSGVYLLLALTHYGYLSMVTVDTLCGAIFFFIFASSRNSKIDCCCLEQTIHPLVT